MEKKLSEYFDGYKRELCEECGECLMKCPVMSLGRNAAVREIRALRAGAPSKYVVKKCQSCFACDLVCHKRANPAELFMEAFGKEIARKGQPAWSSYFQPHEDGNFRRHVISRLPDDEKKMIERWSDMSPCDEFVYPGCNMCVTPYITRASFLRDLNIRGGLDVCCGEMYFRTGMFDRLRACASKLNDYFAALGAKRMMILCTAGYNLFTNILPRYGFESDAEIKPYLPWLLEKIKSGDIEIKKKLNMSVTVQESCHAKIFGPDYYNIPREILEQIGCRVVEMPHSGDCSLCCGIGGGFPAGSGYNPLDITAATMRVVHEAARTGADAIVTYCSGCMQSLSSGMVVYPIKKPVYHLFQMVQMAAGEKVEEKLNRQRGAMLVQGMLLKQGPMMLSKKRLTP